MYYLDFFNSPPQYSIFQKEKNRTQFGGVLFLIYIIVMLFISLVYILDFAINEKYDIEYMTIDSLFSSRSPIEQSELKFDQNVNPMTKFRIRIGLDYQRYIDEKRVNIKQFLDDVYMEYNSTIYKGSFCDNYNCQTAEGDTSYLNFDISMNAYSQYQLVLYLKCHDSICSNYNVSFFKSFEIMIS